MQRLKSVLSARQFSPDHIAQLLSSAYRIEEELKNKKNLNLLKGTILSTLFFEPSTRTRLSFESAMHRLGGSVITSVGMQFSSLAKGESLFDTLKMIEAYADICAIRHPTEGASALAAKNISIPVINAGDGAGEHPTQALLDLYTIEKIHNIQKKPVKIAFIGDNLHGRTVHSLLWMLRHFDVHITTINPEELQLPNQYKTLLDESNISLQNSEDLTDVKECDVLYVTRIQEERFLDHHEYEKYKDSYSVNRDFIKSHCNASVIVMHPLPRLSEVNIDLDNHPSAVYFQQAKNGLYTRMALILYLLGYDFS
jgi:aspartate carbamoyltransferase catalytic subunit